MTTTPGEPVRAHPRELAAIFLGGVAGTLLRYGIGVGAQELGWVGGAATVLVNLVGSFALGLLLAALAARGPDEGQRRLLRLGLGTGVLGAFTTYSAFAVDVALLDWLPALGYIALSLVGGMAAAAAGMALGRAGRRG